MKFFCKIALSVSASIVLASCQKYEALEYQVAAPDSYANQQAIDAFKPLKEYIDRSANPGFKLGAAVSLSDYVNKGVMYRLVNSNFDEITLGYEMKHGAVVKADGKLDLSKIKSLLETASAAGISVYGHTLAWHANQNATYLNKLIAPVIIPGKSQPTWDLVTGANFETDAAANYQSNTNAVAGFTAVGQGANNTGRALKITNAAVRANDYDAQLFLKFSPAVVAGEKYQLKMDVRSDVAASYSTQAHVTAGAYKHWDFFGTISSTPTWSTYTKEITVSADMATSGAIAFNLGKTATTFYFDNITLKKYNEKGSGNAGYSYFFKNPTAGNFWEAQIAYDLAPPLQNNTEYTLKIVAKGSVAGNIRAELQSSADYSSNGFGMIGLTTGWKEYELKVTTTKADRNRFIISFGDYAGTVNIDNVVLTRDGNTNLIATSDFETGVGTWGGWGGSSTRGRSAEGEGYGGAQDQIIEKTPAEKNTLISNAMENWIKEMVTATKDHVKAWDVVNEPMDDGRPAELKTGVGKTPMAADEFYWQDYMGKDYALKAFQWARQYGNATDIHFINDYNLEWSLDKTRGLIAYVNYLEGKGAKIDGIGTQMHIVATSDKAKIVEMFQLLAATGKLIKVSELDMGFEGKTKTPQVTAEQYAAQKEMYQFVVDKYFEIIPAAQRYGITIWSPLDSPAGSGWRAGEPIGLWNEGYVRKPAYVGVADGLSGK